MQKIMIKKKKKEKWEIGIMRRKAVTNIDMMNPVQLNMLMCFWGNS